MARAMAAQNEADAALQRLTELEQEQIRVQTAISDAQKKLEEAQAERYRLATEGDPNDTTRADELERLTFLINDAEEQIADLNGQLSENEALIDEATQNYEDFLGAVAETEDQMDDASNSAEEMNEKVQSLLDASEDLEDQTVSLTSAQDMLTDALTEQAEQGSLSLDTTLDLIDAGYAAALSIDQETGAVRLNQEAYIALAKAKIEEQIAAVQVDREKLVEALNLEEGAAKALAAANYDLAISEYKVDEATAGQVAAYDAQIAALTQLKDNLGSYSFTQKAATRTSTRAVTQAEKDLDKFKDMKAELDHQQAMDLISEQEYYKKLKEYRDAYLTDDDNIEEYRSVTEQIYEYDKSLAEQETELWENQTDALAEELQDRVDAIIDQQEKMQNRLAEYGDLFQVDDGTMSLESLQSQIDAINRYEEAITALQERGLSESLMGEVLELDVDEATQYAEQLLALTDEDWDKYNALWEEKQQRAIEVAKTFYQDQLDTLKTEYDDKLGQALSELTDTSFTSGQDTAQGLIDGLKSKENSLYQQAQKMADRVAQILASASVSSDVVGGTSNTSRSVSTYSMNGAQEADQAGISPLSRAASVSDIGRSLSDALTVGYTVRQAVQSGASATAGISEKKLISAINSAAAGMVNGLSAVAGNQKISIEVPVIIDGKEFYRYTLNDLRDVQRSNPEVLSGV